MTTLGAFNWSTTRGIPASGQVTLASDPLAAVANTLRVSITDADGNDRDAVIDLVAAGDVIQVTDDFGVVVGLPVDNVTYWSFPFTAPASFVEADEPDDAEEVTLLSRVPAAWPTVTELAQVLNVENVTDWQDTLDRVMATAINNVKSTVGFDDPNDLPTEGMAQAALRRAELLAERAGVPVGNSRNDTTYLRALTGQRRRFGIG